MPAWRMARKTPRAVIIEPARKAVGRGRSSSMDWAMRKPTSSVKVELAIRAGSKAMPRADRAAK
ncbi:hypothetical protein D3C71_2138620 [compost metagenome]